MTAEVSADLIPLPRLTAVAVLLFAAAGCGGGGGAPTAPPNLPLTGTFNGTVAAGSSTTVDFVAGRTGSTIVKICGISGVNLDVSVASASSATPSNCERVLFKATAGATYTVRVSATSGSGAFNGCWSIALAECGVTPPPSPQLGCGDAGYFDAATGKTGLALLHALRDIIATNRNLGYLTTPNARDSLYDFVDDPDGDDMIADIYTGRTATVNSRSSAAAANFNTEHVWPESRGADIDYAAGTDLNILFTVDETANGQRSNYPFGVVAGNVSWTGGTGSDISRSGLDAQGRQVFEPRPSKRGDVARAIFYFYTRYHDAPTPTFSLANFNVEEATLFAWAADDPPDDFERARNAAVCRAQGNRNPFIDHPEYLTAIADFPNS